uniref:Leucine-rich repeat-containing N-terminal plant-type domain-containing protein n=1 Tax=Corethron hystrix TaxID=216773 RepID=A0A7S1FLF4_9STRA|mmetsp:Transcript_11087/g.24455  ORF Transcript_11087/g.24455 Transcript_11087/m.24455 type:complete len:385 (+) Transcript_11087:133-1287(+)
MRSANRFNSPRLYIVSQIIRKMIASRVILIGLIYAVYIINSVAGSGSHSGDDQCAADDDDGVYSLTDSEILSIIYSKCSGKHWPKENRTNWMSKKSVCFWSGVTCSATDDDGGQSVVTALDLSYHHLSCTLPGSVFKLQNLQSLDVSNNPKLTMSFTEITYANCLQKLDMSSTGSTSISGIGYAPYLDYLKMSNTYLPNALNEMGTLAVSYLYMSNCRTKGIIPEGFYGDIDDEEYDDHIFMDISNNYLTGTLPYEFSRFTNLYLLADDNMFSGMDSYLCNMTDWNDGMVGNFGCDAIMCPKGTFNELGRMYGSSGIACEPCKRAVYYGSVECRKKTMSRTGSHPFTGFLVFVVGMCGAIFIVKRLWGTLNNNFDFEQHGGLYS